MKNNMKASVEIVLILSVLLFSVNTASAQNQNDVQIIIKSKNLGLDKNFGVYRADINITMNKIGNLTYRESYYYVDYSTSPSKETLFRTNNYAVPMNDYSVSFFVTRPGLKSERDEWNSVKATVLLDKEIVAETLQSGQSWTYKSFTTGKMAWANDSVVVIGKTRPTIEKKPAPSFASERSSATASVEKETKQTPMVGTFMAVTTIFIVYCLIRINRKH